MDDPRLDCALLRPMESEGEHFLAYYLVKDEDAIDELQLQRSDVPQKLNEDSDNVRISILRSVSRCLIQYRMQPFISSATMRL